MNIAPCAKFTMRNIPKITLKPSASRAKYAPLTRPLSACVRM
jgi:hypothetical protein